jgi:hypothetical protein
MTDDPRTAETYQSALDLPSFRNLLEQIQAAKVLTRLVARDKRRDLVKLEKEIRVMAERVDRFYGVLGRRHWIFHESLPTDEIDSLLSLSPADAERSLIALYADPELLQLFIRMIAFRFPAMTARRPLIELALDDFQAGRYYATVHVLLSVMDGFVNDFEPQERRGLHARDEDDMKAWDSVVSHHLGLANAHRTFIKRFSKTSNEEVFELYRNGIVHGVLLSFNNDVVASKAWNRLFAVADWATSREKQAVIPEPEPSWRELLARVKESQEMKKALDTWVPRVLTEDDSSFTDHPVHTATVDYLAAWQRRNYGKMAKLLSSIVTEQSHRKTAGMVREKYEGSQLDSFLVRRIDLTSPVAVIVEADLTTAGRTSRAALRWIHETSTGDMTLPNGPGQWRLLLWGPPA